jgi:hypothetical protein
MNLHTFESFSAENSSSIFVANPLADKALNKAKFFTSLTENEEGFYTGENLVDAIAFLESQGFTSPIDFVSTDSLNEALKVKYEGHKNGPDGVEIQVDINGHKYGYSQKDGDLDIGDIARKFEKMLQFSAGRALNWLKQHTNLTSGSKAAEKKDLDNPEVKESLSEGHEGMENYMFFGNLKTIKACIEKMMALDPAMVDQALSAGHDWANDHIATSKDDIEEVCNWLCNKAK